MAKLSIKHGEIMNFMIANPTVKLSDVAKHFGMTQPWLSCIIHSEAFQAQLAGRQDEVFASTVLPLKEKITAMAHQALDLLVDRLPIMDGKEIAAVADSTLDRLGFGTKPAAPAPGSGGGSVTINVNLRAELEEARRLIGSRGATLPALEVLVDGEAAPIGIGRTEAVHHAGFPSDGYSHLLESMAPDQSLREVSPGNQV